MSQMDGENEEAIHGQKILATEDITPLWESEDPLTELFNIYSSFFNPSHDPEYEVVDDNKIKLIAEFQIYNMIFCKNDLKLGDSQTAEVLHLLWNMLSFNQDGTMYDGSIPTEGNFQNALSNKFEELKYELIERAKQDVLTKDQIKLVMNYMRNGYFKHFRLIDFVLRNRQLRTYKNVTLFHDDVVHEGALDKAKEIVEEALIPRHEGEGEGEGEEEQLDPNKDPLDGLDDRLNKAKLENHEKNEVKSKLQDYKNEANSRLDSQKDERKKDQGKKK